MDGLSAIVKETLSHDPHGGVIYVFRSKRADRLKLLYWNGTGLVPVAMRLEHCSFRSPAVTPSRQLRLLLDDVRLDGLTSTERDKITLASSDPHAGGPPQRRGA